MRNGIDESSVEGASDLPYDIPSFQLECTRRTTSKYPLSGGAPWATHLTAYSTECLMDEAATAAGKDPYEFRRGLLSKFPRHKAVFGTGGREGGPGDKR